MLEELIYYGTKKVSAIPMNRQEYNDYRGLKLPDDENGSDQGYLVEYLDGGKSNHPNHQGYISWSPKEQFEAAYQSSGSLSFGHAMVAMEEGLRVARKGWNGKNMFLFKVSGSTFQANRPPLLGIYPEGEWIEYQSHIDVKTADGTIVPWLCSQSDMQANDWCIL